MMKNYIFLFVLLLINLNNVACFSETKEIIPKLVKTIKLQENHNAILISIGNISYTRDESKLLISDDSGRNLVLYDSSGNILKIFSFGYEISDSLALKSRPFDYPTYEYITTTNILESQKNKPIQLSKEFFPYYLNNEIKNGIFIDDSTILIQLDVRCIKKKKDSLFNPLRIKIANTSNVIKYNLNTDEKELISFESIDNLSFVQSYFIMYNKDKHYYIVSSANRIAFQNQKWDSVVTLSKYSENGKFQKLLFNLPREYIDTKLGYSLNHPKCTVDKSGKMYCVMPISQKVFNLTDNNFFNLKGLKDDNNKYIKNIYKKNLNANQIIDENDHYYFLPNYVVDIFNTKNDNLYVWVIQYDMNKDKPIVKKMAKHTLQKYTTDGKLIKQFSFDPKTKNGSLQYILYLKYSERIFVFRKSVEKGWIIEVYKEN